jgi:hypothetical protein
MIEITPDDTPKGHGDGHAGSSAGSATCRPGWWRTCCWPDACSPGWDTRRFGPGSRQGWTGWRGLLVVAIDGTIMSVADSGEPGGLRYGPSQ